MKKIDIIPSVADFKYNHSSINLAAQDHTKIIRSGWDLMAVVTLVVREICTDCLVFTICSGACQNYHTVYGAMMGWLGGCTYKVSEDELIENLNYIVDTLVE